MELPKQKVKATQDNAKVLVLFSKPKIGKTLALSQLEGNLILDTEHGTDYYDSMKINIENYNQFRESCEEIIKAGKPYKYLTLDTMTSFEDMALRLAEMLYMKTAMGKNWITLDENGKMKNDCQKAIVGGSILNLPQGLGYRYLWDAVTDCINLMKKACDRIILTCHLKEKVIDKNGIQFETKDVDLTGKVKTIINSRCDAIGYVFRKGKQNWVTFNPGNDLLGGSRQKHLGNNTLLLSEYLDDGTYKTYWENIYTDYAPNN